MAQIQGGHCPWSNIQGGQPTTLPPPCRAPAHTHTRMHTLKHAHARTHTYHRLRSGSMCRWHPSGVTNLTPSFMAGSWVIQINTSAGDPIYLRFWLFSHIKKLLGRTETRTCDRMYCHMIRTVRDISQDDRARIATCSL